MKKRGKTLGPARKKKLTQGRKRLAFTIKQKMKIIQEIERGKSKSDVARELGLASSTVATIWKNRVSIAESWRNRDVMQTVDGNDGGDGIIQTKKSSGMILGINAQTPISSLPPPLPPPPLSAASMTTPPATSPTIAPGVVSSCSITPTDLTGLSSVSTCATMIVHHQQDNNTQQAQTQTQNQEMLEVRCRYPPKPPRDTLAHPECKTLDDEIFSSVARNKFSKSLRKCEDLSKYGIFGFFNQTRGQGVLYLFCFRPILG